MPEQAQKGYHGLDWSLLFRDVLPRRHPTQPYAADASPEIVAHSGPSVKHSLQYEFRTNGRHCNDRFNPTSGVDAHAKLELAGPPGDVGFLKFQGGLAAHVEVPNPPFRDHQVALHGSCQTGILLALAYQGLCGPPTISDRFFVGGPMQLRGFVPGGIGPRAKTVSPRNRCQKTQRNLICSLRGQGGASTPGGDALGGELFYVATLAASVPFPSLIPALRDSGMRLFAFGNVGTLASSGTSFFSILRSTRTSVGCGVTMATPFGRMEATYAIPTRFGPRDARRSVQLGIGFVFG